MNVKFAQFIPKNPIKYQSSKPRTLAHQDSPSKFPELHGGLHAAFSLCDKISVPLGSRIVRGDSVSSGVLKMRLSAPDANGAFRHSDGAERRGI